MWQGISHQLGLQLRWVSAPLEIVVARGMTKRPAKPHLEPKIDHRFNLIQCTDLLNSLFFNVAGTGSISILFHTFPYGTNSPVMRALSLVLFFLNLALFVLFTALSAARYTLFPGIWDRMLRHPVQSLYLGTFPMGATTLLTVSITVIHATYNFGGQSFIYVIWALWWLDVAISILCCWGTIHIMITRHEHSLESMTLAWLLPVVTLVVGASTGGVIAQALIPYSLHGALLTLVFSTFMVVIGLALTMMNLTVYLLRTITFGYAKGPFILSIFFPLGPCGQGAYALLLIGSGFKAILPLTYGETDGLLRQSSTGEIIDVICFVIAFALWTFGSMWLMAALLGLWYSLRRARVPFRLTFWSMIFPNGVYANCTLALATTLSSTFFRVWGAIYALATLSLWVCVAVQTLRMCPSGRIFDALPTEEKIGQNDRAAPDEEKTLPNSSSGNYQTGADWAQID
ncbi:voltage-dependent anion channel-domain-containing protein [Chiua virens]|nr:voltage-dependent anion channel-domain-containing protein [Chiua virens]